MKALSLILASGLLGASAAQAQAGPDWIACIDSGDATDNSAVSTAAHADTVAALEHSSPESEYSRRLAAFSDV
jgi:hypothetical protein